MRDLLVIAHKFNTRVILQGDKKQLDSVESGTPFNRLIEKNLINYSELNNILRQKDEIIKQAVYDIIKKDVIHSFQKLENNKHIIELRNNNDLDPKNENYINNVNQDNIKKDIVNKVIETYKSFSEEDKNNTLIVTSSNEIRKKINNEIRNLIKQDNQKTNLLNTININTLEQKSLTLQEKKEIQNYNIGNSIIFTKDNTTINVKKGEEYEITKINQIINKNKIINEIIIQKINSKNEKLTINLSKYASSINLFEKSQKELIINDKLKWTITDKEYNSSFNIIKGEELIVKSIENNIITISNIKNKKNITLNLNNQKDIDLIKHIDYGYTTTSYSAQGKTSKNVIMTLESYRPNLTTQKDFYVG